MYNLERYSLGVGAHVDLQTISSPPEMSAIIVLIKRRKQIDEKILKEQIRSIREDNPQNISISFQTFQAIFIRVIFFLA